MALHNRPDSTSQPPARPLLLLHPERRAQRATAAGPGAAEGSLVSAASTASASGGASTGSPGACGGRDPQEPMQMVEETEVVGTTPREGLPLCPPPPPPAAVTSSRPEHGESTRYGPPQCPPPPSVFHLLRVQVVCDNWIRCMQEMSTEDLQKPRWVRSV